MRSFDVLVLGAGIVGAACARECALAGMRVGVVEPGAPGGGVTGAGMGHVVVMDDSPAQLALTRLGRTLWKELRDTLPTSVEYEQRGTLWVASDSEEMAEVQSKHRTYTSSGIEAEILDVRSIAEAEPNLRAGLMGGLLVPEDSVIYPPAAARFFLDEALVRGAELIRGEHAIAAKGGVVTLRDGSQLGADRIVVATGTDIRLAPGIPVQPRKGHLVITDRYPGYVRHQLVELGYLKSAHTLVSDSIAFNVQPRQTGQLLIGSSRQYGDMNPAVETGILRRMMDKACSYLPGIRHLSAIRAWTGFRAATPDKLPLIGPTADPAVSLLMGFEGLGITNAPAAARLLADQFLGRRPALDATPYLPARLEQVIDHA